MDLIDGFCGYAAYIYFNVLVDVKSSSKGNIKMV